MPTVFACSANAQLTPPSYDGSQQLDTKREEVKLMVTTSKRRIAALILTAILSVAMAAVTASMAPLEGVMNFRT